MKYKITVKTPRNQAERSMAFSRSALLGLKHSRNVIEEKLLGHNEFYWVIETSEDELQEIMHKCARGEMIIRKFYSIVFKLLHRANRIAEKCGKAGMWFKRWIIGRLKKLTAGQEENGLVEQFENMNEEEFQDFIQISDEEEIHAFLEGELIKVELWKDG